MREIYYKIIPFLSSLLLGILFLVFSFYLNNKFQNFVQGISASLIAIPFVFLGYGCVRHISQKHLKHELFEFAKMQIDTELIGILHNFYKIFFSLESKIDTDLLERMIHIKRNALYSHLSSHEFLGFQINKSFRIRLSKIDTILHNGYFLKYVDDDQIIALIRLYRTLNAWNALLSQLHEECFYCSGKSTDEYQIVSSSEKCNRLILLKKRDETTGVVCDFRDFENFDDEKLLCFYKIKPDFLQLFTNYIVELFENINDWIELTGKEFLMNPQEFRFRRASSDKSS